MTKCLAAIKHQLALLCAISGISSLSYAGVDLVGSVENVSVTVLESGNQRMSFDLKVKNIGDVPYDGRFSFKPILIATDAATAPHFSQRGAVLDGQVLPSLTVQPGEEVSVGYSSTLPKIRRGDYRMSIFINNDASVVESETLNNMTDLVDVNNLEVLTAPDDSGAFNITTEIDGDVRMRQGGVSHWLKTIVHGDPSQFPGPAGNDEDLWARFLLIDMKSRKVFSAAYVRYGGSAVTTCKGYQVDKEWFAISYSNEFDYLGNPIFIDYYNQSPCFEDLEPGDYLFAEIINSRDLVKETNVHDNLSLIPVQIAPTNISKFMPELWMVSENNAPVTQAISLSASYVKTSAWSIDLTSAPTSLRVDVRAGQIGNDSPGQNLNFTWDGSGVEQLQAGELAMSFEKFPNAQQRIPYRLFSFAAGLAPVLTVTGEEKSIVLDPVPSVKTVTFKFQNTGLSPMHWKAMPFESFVTLEVSEGTLQPGESQDLAVEIDLRRISANRSQDALSVMLLNSSLEPYKILSINTN